MSFLQLSCKPGEWYANAQYYYNGTIYFFLAIVCTLSHLRQSFMCNATLLNGTRLEKNRLIIPQHNLSNQNIRVQILSILLWESDYRILIFYMKRLLQISFYIYIYIYIYIYFWGIIFLIFVFTTMQPCLMMQVQWEQPCEYELLTIVMNYQVSKALKIFWVY